MATNADIVGEVRAAFNSGLRQERPFFSGRMFRQIQKCGMEEGAAEGGEQVIRPLVVMANRHDHDNI